jgi:uncharacterized protein (TIGR03118 family)
MLGHLPPELTTTPVVLGEQQMKILRAATAGMMGVLGLIVLQSCGGGGHGSALTPASIAIAIAPTTVTVGKTAVLTWNAISGTTCTASGAWSGTQANSGTLSVTPTAAGSETFTLTCTGGIYSSASNSAVLTVTALTGFSVTALTADVAGGTAANVDAKLVNPWGVSIPAGTAPAWVSNNGSQTSTLYDGNGKPQPAATPLIVQLAAGANGPFAPTGIVSNGSTTDFIVTAASKSGSSAFLFDGDGGMIAGWSPGVDLTHAVTAYTDAGGADYKGLAIATNAGALFLYATDFHNNKIDVFNTTFVKQTTSATAFTFADPAIPAGYAPFGIQAINNGTAGATQIYVTYAQQAAPANIVNTAGAGLGYVDIYDTNGQLIKQLIAAGSLNAPWGLALAPADFGTYSNDLLVGNLGDGKINAYDPTAGTLIGPLGDSSNAPLVVPGLLGIAFGNDANNQPHNTLFFASGPNAGADGLYGRIDMGGPPVLNAAPVVALTVPSGTLSGTVALSATVTDPLKVAKVDFLANGTVVGTATASPYTVQWDTTKIADGQVSVVGRATDADGNVGSSAASTVTVANTTPPPAQVTLTQLQTQIFTPICSVCHTGVGTALPGVQNLTNGNTFANIVNVASIEVPTLKRITPNDTVNSYLIQKIEGAAGIVGAQMPAGCPTTQPCLDQATIDMVKTWVSQGALNN